MHGLIGRKIGMSQVFAENGDAVPVTVIEAGPCYVTQVKTLERDGYEAAQIGFEAKKEKQTTRPLQGHFKKAKVDPQRIVREVAVQDIEACEPGQVVGADIFETGELVDVTGYFKGRGFQGVVKRHGFKRRRQDPRTERPLAPSRIDRAERDAVQGLQGHPHGRSDGQQARNRQEPAGGRRGRREEHPPGEGRGAGTPERIRTD